MVEARLCACLVKRAIPEKPFCGEKPDDDDE
jgi:hypothetical protein